MGKKRLRQKYTSKGERHSVSREKVKGQRRDYMASGSRIMNQLIAFHKGKKVMLTIENPNKTETNKRFIRVDAKTVWKVDDWNTKDKKPAAGEYAT